MPPEVSLNILEQCARLGLKNVWVQPGAHSQQTNSFLQSRGFNYLSGDCIMVLSRSKV